MGIYDGVVVAALACPESEIRTGAVRASLANTFERETSSVRPELQLDPRCKEFLYID